MNLLKGYLFRSFDWGIKFEIILKILFVALFSCLLMGIITYKLFESSLLHSEIRQLSNDRGFFNVLQSDPHILRHLKRLNPSCRIWILDRNFHSVKGEGPVPARPLTRLKPGTIYVQKRGSFFTKYLRVYMLLPANVFKNKFIFLSKDLSSLNKVLSQMRMFILFIMVVTVSMLVFLLNIFLKATIIHPMERIKEDLGKIKRGEAQKLNGNYMYEYKYLVYNFNELLYIIERQKSELSDKIKELYKLNRLISEYNREMIKVEKLISIGELSAGIAHEIGNPLNNIQGYLSLLKRDSRIMENDSLNDYVRRIEADIKRIHGIIRNILNYSRKDGFGSLVQISVIDVVEKALDLAQLRMQGKEIFIEKNYEFRRDVTVTIDPSKAQQVLLNLINNAADSIHQQGRIEINLKRVANLPPAQEKFFMTMLHKKPRAYILLEIRDNGTGIDPEILPRVFDPFFTTKEVGKGTGLGLSVALKLVREMGGTILIDSEKGKGSAARIILAHETDS